MKDHNTLRLFHSEHLTCLSRRYYYMGTWIYHIWVKKANNLPNMDSFNEKFKPLLGTSDPNVIIYVSNVVVGRTFVITNSENPVWMQHLYVPVAYYASEVRFVVKDDDAVGSKLIGTVGIPAELLLSDSVFEGTFPILNACGQPCKLGAILTLSIQYTPVDKVLLYRNVVGFDSELEGVPGTYFPLRRGGKVTLYQDAHVDGNIPSMKLDRGLKYVQKDCWSDICDAIRQARRLIYITGWSIYHKVQLVRYGMKARDSILGELPKSKSEEGVRVLLLVWDDPTSKSILGYKTEGVMQTHDEETRAFFKYSSVQVLLCPRSAGKVSWMKKDAETIYTHNQKTVIVDADAGIKRRITAFVGGLDLCTGRYDTPEHSLFSTLHTLHKDDYHNPNYIGSSVGCPREPWHDLHCRIEGPAAYDVLQNFEERWLRASKPCGLSKMKKFCDNEALLKLDRIPDILGITDACYTSEKDPEGWHVQIFRSIDSNSVKGFPQDLIDVPSKNLVCGKNMLIDMSIHTAYVKSIRSAQHFIYIENEFFLGSSYNWNDHKGLGADNLIPMEIALKIANKIQKNERFGVYIIIPMWPEGNPMNSATQRILYWQVYGYRMSLWAEHIGKLERCFEQPESIECVRRVRLLAEQNWHQYAANEPCEMTAHLLKYPVVVDGKGQVKPQPGCPNFPDMGGSIVGSFMPGQENLTI